MSSGLWTERQGLDVINQRSWSDSSAPGRDTPVRPIHYPLDKDLSKFILQDHFVSDEIHEAIKDGELVETMDGASALTLQINDPQRTLLHSGLLKQWMGINPTVYAYRDGRRRKIEIPHKWDDVLCSLDGRDFALAGVSKSGHEFDLTFENRAINVLRGITKPRTWYRDAFTRAQVIHETVKEASKASGYQIHWHSPEERKIQPIASSTDQMTPSEIKNSRHAGFAPQHRATVGRVTVKGAGATPQQISIIERVLRVGLSMGASYRVLVSAIMCITQESDVSLLNGQGGYGPFSQLRNGAWPASVTDVEADARAYFRIAIANDRQNPNQPLTLLVQSVQRSAYPNAYAQWEAEAKRTLAAFGDQAGPGGVSAGSSVTYQEYNRYAFHRGQDGAREDSWTFDKRLADEVAWRLFMVNNTLYYVEDNQLIKSKPFDVIAETDDGIDEINYDIDTNKKIQTCTVLCHPNRWMVPPGAVIVVEDNGVGNGRWLVQQIRYPLFASQCEVTLAVPSAPKPEPAPSTRSVTINQPATGGSGGGKGGALGSASSSVPGHPELQPGISRLVNIVLAKWPRLHINSTVRSGENPNTCSHTAGRACDVGDGTEGSAYMDAAARWIDANYRSQICQGIHQGIDHSACLSVNAGSVVGSSFWADQWPRHINHIHIAI